MENFDKMLAGVGLFFAGLYLLKTALQQLASRRLRVLLAKYTENAWQGGLIGCVLGVIVQSVSAISFIIAGLISAGMIRLKQATPVILWSNFGLSLIVVLAFLNINLVIFLILGVAGIGFAFEKPARRPALSQALFGVGLIFFGLNTIRTGAAPFSEMRWFQTLLSQGQDYYWISFLIGVFATLVVQSAVAIMILTITFAQSGVLTLDQTLMMIYGANMGGGLLPWILSINVKGTARQIIWTQIVARGSGAFFFIVLFYLEKYGGISLVKATSVAAFGEIGQQMSFVCVLYNLFSAVLMSFLKQPLISFLEWFCPPSQEEEWSKIHYLHDRVLQNPETALEMAEKEQLRLFVRLPFYLEETRKVNGIENKSSSLTAFHKAFLAVSKEIEAFLSEILQNSRNHITSEQAFTVKNRQHSIALFEKTLFDFSRRLLSWNTDESAHHPKTTFLEGLDFLLLTACEVFENPNPENLDYLLALTGDRSELMLKMRTRFLANNLDLNLDNRMIFLQITALYERAIWILGRIGLLMRQSNADDRTTDENGVGDHREINSNPNSC